MKSRDRSPAGTRHSTEFPCSESGFQDNSALQGPRSGNGRRVSSQGIARQRAIGGKFWILETDHLDDQFAALVWLRKQSFAQPNRFAVAKKKEKMKEQLDTHRPSHGRSYNPRRRRKRRRQDGGLQATITLQLSCNRAAGRGVQLSVRRVEDNCCIALIF
jgi:hypothetical protein